MQLCPHVILQFSRLLKSLPSTPFSTNIIHWTTIGWATGESTNGNLERENWCSHESGSCCCCVGCNSESFCGARAGPWCHDLWGLRRRCWQQQQPRHSRQGQLPPLWKRLCPAHANRKVLQWQAGNWLHRYRTFLYYCPKNCLSTKNMYFLLVIAMNRTILLWTEEVVSFNFFISMQSRTSDSLRIHQPTSAMKLQETTSWMVPTLPLLRLDTWTALQTFMLVLSDFLSCGFP